MLQKDKELLLKDLCSRLPYGVKCAIFNKNLGFEGKYPFVIDGITQEGDDIDVWLEHGNFSLETVKPYLFPLSSMTEEQDKEYALLQTSAGKEGFLYAWNCATMMKWLLENHFDYNGLIPKGLAIDATGKNIY